MKLLELPARDLARDARVRPITSADIPAVAEFLHAEMNRRLSPAVWAASIQPSWAVDAPNHGFMLVAQGRVVGVQLAFYCVRNVAGKGERFCNIAAWCVVPGFRADGIKLLSAVLAQKDYTFTDLSPSGNVVPLNRRLKFEFLDTRTVMVLNLPWPSLDRSVRVLSDPHAIEPFLSGSDLDILRDHMTARAAHHVLVRRGVETCYVLFRRDRRKGLRLFASLLYVGNPDLFRAASRVFFSHLLLRFGVVATMVEKRIVDCAQWPSARLPAPRPKMFRSTRLRGDEIDYLYSELACVPW